MNFCRLRIFFFKNQTSWRKKIWNIIYMLNSWDQDQAQHFVVPDLGPNCMQRLSADSKTCVKWPLLKKHKLVFKEQLSLNAGQKYCRMLQGEHSAILSIFIKLPFVITIFILLIFEWPFYTDFTVSLWAFKANFCACKIRTKMSCADQNVVLLNESISMRCLL